MTKAQKISTIKQQISWLKMQEANLQVHGIINGPAGQLRTEDFDTKMYNLNKRITDWAAVEIKTELQRLNNELSQLHLITI